MRREALKAAEKIKGKKLILCTLKEKKGWERVTTSFDVYSPIEIARDKTKDFSNYQVVIIEGIKLDKNERLDKMIGKIPTVIRI